jgi:hypothetical protein
MKAEVERWWVGVVMEIGSVREVGDVMEVGVTVWWGGWRAGGGDGVGKWL